MKQNDPELILSQMKILLIFLSMIVACMAHGQTTKKPKDFKPSPMMKSDGNPPIYIGTISVVTHKVDTLYLQAGDVGAAIVEIWKEPYKGKKPVIILTDDLNKVITKYINDKKSAPGSGG